MKVFCGEISPFENITELQEIEDSDSMTLNFVTYSDNELSVIDLDNAEIEDLTSINAQRKTERETVTQQFVLPQEVFFKNRTVSKENQEKLLHLLMTDSEFSKYSPLLTHTVDVEGFLHYRWINKILNTFYNASLIDEITCKKFSAIANNYYEGGFKALLGYEVGKYRRGYYKSMDRAYSEAFKSLKDVLEHKIPKILSLFESIVVFVAKQEGIGVETFSLSSSGDWSGNVYDFYFRVYNKLIQDIKVPFKMDGGTRIDDTPVHQALREALANCLVNADYYGRQGLVIVKKRNSITMSNPGSFRIEIDAAKSGGVSDPRNGAMLKMFNLIDIGERAGSGIPNIFRVWREQNWTTPDITEQLEPERTILSLAFEKASDKKQAIKASNSTIYSRQKQSVIEYLTREIQADCKTIADLLEISSPRARAVLTKMVKEEIIITEGGNRNRTYKLKS